MPDNTDYDIPFKAPALPLPPVVYEQRYFDGVNNVLRIYFNQLDQALRSSRASDQAEATGWFLG
tara:strand:- start:432 stop:623 length:192 start_codon:yes stop_codon:yes gene_type:complete